MPVTMSDTEKREQREHDPHLNVGDAQKMSQVGSSPPGSPRDLSMVLSRAQRFSLAARRAIKAPDDVAKTSPSVAKKIGIAVAVAAAGMLTRRFLSRYLAEFAHLFAERRGSPSGRPSRDQTARSSELA